jgi:hypothetical protein
MRNLFRINTILILLLGMNAYATTNEQALPDVLDYYPRCNYEVLKGLTVNESSFTAAENIAGTEHRLKQQLLNALKLQAQKISADAIIVTKLESEQITHNAFISRENNNNRLLKISANAEFITRCEDDIKLEKKPTQYNSRLERVVLTQTFKLKPLVLQPMLPKKDQKAFKQPDMSLNISFSEGFFGAKQGIGRSALQNLLGNPSAKFTFTDNVQAMVYGKSHWFLFQNDQLFAVKQTNNFLTSATTQLLPEDSRFDRPQWKLDNKFAAKSPLQDMLQYYGESLQPVDRTTYQLTQDHNVIRLFFTEYLNLQTAEKQLKLSNLEFATFDNLQTNYEVPLADSEHITELLTFFSGPAFDYEQWQNKLNMLPKLHHIVTGFDTHIEIYDSAFAILYNADMPSEIILQPFYAAPNAVTKFKKHLSLIGQPQNRSQFLALYHDTFEVSGELQVFGDQYDVTATFDDSVSEDLDSIRIKLRL